MKFKLTSIKIKGFRGFPEQAGFREFRFDEPCALLLGEQRAGKSSVLCAVEWCLFGDKIAHETRTGIQERKRWLIKNKNSNEAVVEISLERNGELLKVCRYDRKKPGHTQFYYQLNNGPQLTDEVALLVMLGVELADYMSCVHLHQEVINALLVEDPKERKNSLDRLMGLAELRNLDDGIREAKIDSELREIDNQFSGIECVLRAKMNVKRDDLSRALEDAREHAIQEKDLTIDGTKARCEIIAIEMGGFAKDFGLPEPLLHGYQCLDEIEIFFKLGLEAIRNLRNEQPDLKRQTEMLKHKTDLLYLKTEFEKKRAYLGELLTKNEELKSLHGEPSFVSRELENIEAKNLPEAKNKRNAIDIRAGVISEALKLFESSEGEKIKECPVCENKEIDHIHVRKHLNEWQDEMKDMLGPIDEEIQSLEQKQSELKGIIRQFGELKKEIDEKDNEIKKDTMPKIARAIEIEISETDDPAVFLNKEIVSIDKDLESLRYAVEQSNARLNRIEDQLADVKRINAVLSLQKYLDNLSRVKDLPEYKELEEARMRAHAYGDRANTIRETIQAVLKQNAEGKIKKTKEAISTLYRELVNRSDFPDIEIDPEKYEIMAVGAGESEVALRILNKGDINCAALSIFLALASLEEMEHNIGFIVLDDPSQCLDPVHKDRLANVLNHVLENKQLIIATSEDTFGLKLQNMLVKMKKIYRMGNWSAEKGPEIGTG
jgi:DNA repair exonuclease SbcCD ATPase subunit